MTTEAVRNDRRNGSLDSSRWRRRPAPAVDDPCDLFTDAATTNLELAVARVSRIRGPRQILRRLRGLIIANHRTMVRCETDDERRWTARVHTALRELTDEGEQVLPDAPEPRRLSHRARKRPRAPLVEPAP